MGAVAMLTAADEAGLNERRGDSHPTREEWEGRQRNGPPQLRAWLAHLETERLTREAARRAEQEAAEAAANARRCEFANGLAKILTDAGLDFLAGCARPWAYPPPEGWSGDTDRAAIDLDGEAFGLYPIRLEIMRAPDMAGDPIYHVPHAGYLVERPAAYRRCNTLAEAIAEAARYSSTPF